MSVSIYWCRTEQLLSVQGASPERLSTNGHELLFSQAMDTSQNPHLSGVSNNLVCFLTFVTHFSTEIFEGNS